MGNTLTSFQIRAFIFLALLASTTIATAISFPYAKDLLSNYSIQYYHYRPSQILATAAATAVDTKPANAVPFLMYHGIVKEDDGVNTNIKDFIEQMEMLKLEGYQTISISEYDLFRQGKFILPPKPIVITFDDGRKDSYYTTDDVLRQLGFKATIFVATGPIIEDNSFYLTWKELKEMKESGRWEIEAHGRHSHEEIPVSPDPEAQKGRYLTSRMHLAKEGRLETVAEFEKRVEDDYIHAIDDLKTNVGVTPRYFSVPLNDYGDKSYSNHPDSVAFNGALIKKYFHLGFVQANSFSKPERISGPVYNFAYADPYSIHRVEVASLNTDQLAIILEGEKPSTPKLRLAGANFSEAPFNQKRFVGKIIYSTEGLTLSADEPRKNGQIIFGKEHWRNYEASATFENSGRSAVLLFGFQDSDNFLSFGQTDRGFFLHSTVEGVTRELAKSYVPQGILGNEPLTLAVIYDNGVITGSVNGKVIYSRVRAPIQTGAVGFKVWDDSKPGSGILRELTVKEI